MKRRKMYIENCAPSITRKQDTNKHSSCYTPKDMKRLKAKFNKTRRHKIVATKSEEIWADIADKTNCIRESCFATTLNEQPLQFTPKQPHTWAKNPTSWLSSTDIELVLKQYKSGYPEFNYIGPSPADFHVKKNGQCVWNDLCNFSLEEQLAMGHTKIGIVFNIDVDSGPGMHWVAIFIDMSVKKFYYFDSTGNSIHNEKHIYKFYELVKKQDKSYTLTENYPVEHQFGNTECGIYSIFFIVTMLKTSNFKLFTNKNTFPDKEMVRLRTKYFNL